MKRETYVKIMIALAVILLVAALIFFVPQIQSIFQKPSTPPSAQNNTNNGQSQQNLEQEPAPTIEDDGLPHDKLFITPQRQEYQDGDLTLIIPKLNLNEKIWSGTDAKTLNRGVCLYEYAQLPGEGNKNVSLAAHRNGRVTGKVTDNAPFYYIDTLTSGDYLYLMDRENIYQYQYLDTTVVEANDWGPIYSQGFSCITLASCEPIGISTHRIIVRGKLQHVVLATQDYIFDSNNLQ